MMNRWIIVVLLLLSTSGLLSCTNDASEPDSQLTIPTAIAAGEDRPVAAPTNTFSPLPLPPTMAVGTTEPAATVTPKPSATPTIEVREPRYQVVFVESDDVLNVRSGPGAENEIVGELPLAASDLRIVGPGQRSGESTWVPIDGDGTAGWVNSRFISESLDEAQFCENEAVQSLLDELKEAVGEGNGNVLSRLIHPERGLRIRLAWWNPEVWISGEEVSELFESREIYDWGIEDGSGNAIEGTFVEKTLPLLAEDLLPGGEVACNEILHGGTAGLVQLPDTYEGIAYYSFYRPGTDEFGGMDWGTWVVGVEKWQGKFYLSYLLHFAWEI